MSVGYVSLLVAPTAYYSALTMQEKHSSETSAIICQITRCHVPEDIMVTIMRISNLMFNLDDAENTLLRNVGDHLSDYIVSCARRYYGHHHENF
jgi:hypothetical protein